MTLQLYILRQILLGLAFAVGGMVFIAIPGLAVSAVHKVGGTGASALLRYLPLAAADLLPYLLPLGFLLAIVATYGRLAADGEWTAILMAGIHPLRMLLMPLGLAALLTAGTVWLLSEVTPHLAERQKAFLRDAGTRALKTLNPGRSDVVFGDFQLISRFREGNTFRDVFIQVPDINGGKLALRADLAEIKFPSEEELSIELVRSKAVLRSGERSLSSDNDFLTVRVPIARLFEGGKPTKNRPKYWSDGELLEKLANDEVPPEKRHQWWWELHRRWAHASTYLMFLVLGAPTGLLMRRGTGLGALACAVGYGLIYYLLSLRLGRELSSSAVVPAWVGAWATIALGFACGFVLLWRALRR